MLIDKVEKKGGLSLQRLMHSPHPTKSICFIFFLFFDLSMVSLVGILLHVFILKDILIHKINGVKMLLGSYNDDNGL